MAVSLPVLQSDPVRPDFARGPASLASVKLLRLSVTDRCNFRCLYCMPDDGVPFHQRQDLLTAPQILAVARAAVSVGVTHIKVTGGEPTVRRDLLELIAGLRKLGPIDLSMTTNGLLLKQLAIPLRDAGLDRLTVSLDSLRPDRFASIVRGGHPHPESLLDRVWEGLDAAAHAGFERIKINTVVIGGINDDEVADFARLSLDRPWTIRFIEYMPLGDATLADDAHTYTVDNAEILRRIETSLGPLTPVDRQREAGVGPALVYQLPRAAGRVGFISAMSKPFCETCNRLRLTAVGELRACLFDGGEVSVMPAMSPVPNVERIKAMMAQCVGMKPETHSARGNRAMSQLGG